MALFAFLLYANTINHGYVLDDKAIITANKLTPTGFKAIPKLLTTPYWYGLKGEKDGVYRPISPVSFAIEAQFSPKNPTLSHFINVFLYGLSIFLLFIVLIRLFSFGKDKIVLLLPFIVTALFAAHPLHTEVVANVKSRDELLALLFALGGIYFLVQYAAKGGIKNIIFCSLLYFLSLMSKEHTLTLLAVFPMLLIWFCGKSIVTALKVSLGPLLAAGVFLGIYFSVTEVVHAGGLHVFDNALNADAPAIDILATKIEIIGKYLWLLLVPHPLIYDYSFNHIPITSFGDWKVIISLLTLVGLLVLAAKGLWQTLSGKGSGFFTGTISFSILWLFITLSIVSNFFFLIGSTMAERFLFLPSLGFVLALGLILMKITKTPFDSESVMPKKVPLLMAFVVLILSAYSFKTVTRGSMWKDELTLFKNDLKHMPNNAKAHHNLANLYIQDAENSKNQQEKTRLFKMGITEIQKAIKIYPRVPELHRDLGNAYGNLGQFDKAIKSYKQVLSIQPNDLTAHLQVGKAYGFSQQYDAGLTHLKLAHHIDKNNVDVLLALGVTYGMQRQYQEAVSNFLKANEVKPGNKETLNYLVTTYRQIGDEEKAQYYLRQLK